MYKLWASKVASDPSLLSSAIDHSVCTYKHIYDQLKSVPSEAVQAILHGEDAFCQCDSDVPILDSDQQRSLGWLSPGI